MRQALDDGDSLLVEATSNQVDQFGGYTGMRPAEFHSFVHALAARVGLPPSRVLLGGDHLGPNPWRSQPNEQAMQRAEDLVAAYAAAGFVKIHLDASMACADDPARLDDETVASRAARLCARAEAAALPEKPLYVIGTEVPTPGGATEELAGVEVTRREAARHSLAVHEEAFRAAGLVDAWKRVMALVVQPGVEFDHLHVIDYRPELARQLVGLLDEEPQLVFEAHSTDYQRLESLEQLVRDGFCILKVGPALTFAMREALYALSEIERVLVPSHRQVGLPAVVDEVMRKSPARWERYYPGDPRTQAVLRVYSYSDRIRYYWSEPVVASALGELLARLGEVDIPENLLSQHLPGQYQAVRAGRIDRQPLSLVLDRIRDVLRTYAAACSPGAAAH